MRNEILMMWAWTQSMAHVTSRKVTRDERGATALEWILIAAGTAAIAIAAVAIIRGKVLGKANSIPTD